MSTEIKVPSLGESVQEVTISEWYCKIGDKINKNDLLVEFETDKVTQELRAPFSGIILKINHTIGKIVRVGEILCELDENSDQNVEQKIISPAAAKIARENNIDVQKINIQGSGKAGRCTKGDILTTIKEMEGVKSICDHDNTIDNITLDTTKEQNDIHMDIIRVPMTKLRQTIATRLKDVQNTAAILSTFNEIDMYQVVELRKKYKQEFNIKHETKLGFISFFVKATIQALKHFPIINAEVKDNNILYKNYYSIGIAIGTESGLIVPVIHNADKLSIAEIERKIIDFAEKAKQNKLSLSDLTGGTFTITNGGIYGSMLSTPIINPPQSGILGMHSIIQRPIVKDDQVVIRPMMYVALSYDHRIIDGREAVQFLFMIKQLIEDPMRLILDL